MYILEALINRPDHRATEEELISEVRTLEEQVLAEAASPDALKYFDPKSVDIFRAVLEVALEDEQITNEELNLIRRLREKLGLHEKTKRILLARLDHFPRRGNVLHSPTDFRDLLIDLQRRGVVFYCNKLDGGCYVVPEEIVGGVRSVLGIEMTRVGWDKLLEHLTTAQLATILDAAGLPKSGKPGLELIHMEASDHCDGAFSIGRRGDILMWDNKSKETVYTLPPSTSASSSGTSGIAPPGSPAS